MESHVTPSELPTLTGIDLSEQEALDPEAIPATTQGDKADDRETNNSSVAAAASQPFKAFIPPTSFYAKPPEKKEKRKPLRVTRLPSGPVYLPSVS